jgi:hypothetical protein
LPALAERFSEAAKEKVQTVQEYFALAGRAHGCALARAVYLQDQRQQIEVIGGK